MIIHFFYNSFNRFLRNHPYKQANGPGENITSLVEVMKILHHYL